MKIMAKNRTTVLAEKYIEFMDWYCPYRDAYEEDPHRLEHMLYNLQEMHKDINNNGNPDEEFNQRISEVIELFKHEGITAKL